ncbi:hypothetical protein M2275_008149 [Rhodococcus opacus]|nr:hypothetical protein [Rhodococcus opacus]MDH6293204.1 hypothetical protein [Rhodococcus opacus]
MSQYRWWLAMNAPAALACANAVAPGGAGFADQHLEVVIEGEDVGEPAERAVVAGDHPRPVEHLDPTCAQPHRQPPARVVGGYGVEVLPHRHPRMGVDPRIQQSRAVERLGRQPKQDWLLVGERDRHRDRATPDGPGVVEQVRGRDLLVELGQRRRLRHRNQVPAPKSADLAFDATLLVGATPTRDTKERVEAIVAAQGDEAVRLDPVTSPKHPHHSRFEVVVADTVRHTAEPLEGPRVSLEERLLRLGTEHHSLH